MLAKFKHHIKTGLEKYHIAMIADFLCKRCIEKITHT